MVNIRPLDNIVSATARTESVTTSISTSTSETTSTIGVIDVTHYYNLCKDLANAAAASATSANNSATSASGYATSASNYATNASTSATNAATSEDNAEVWAEGTDAEVILLGGTHSAKTWADMYSHVYVGTTAPTDSSVDVWIDESGTETPFVTDVKVNNISVVSSRVANIDLTGKQDVLTAGNNIQIVNNTISATDTTYTAGTGISIVDNVISNTQTSAEWGNITGTLSSQTDLQTALNAKYDASNPAGYTSNTGTITGITMNGSSKGTSGVIDLGTVITSLAGYATETFVTSQGYITASAIGNGIITIQKNSTTVDSFTANQSANKTINISVPKTLVFTNETASSWYSDTTYNDFNYACNVYLSGVTSSMSANITYNIQNAISGYYAPICETYDGYIKIYSKTDITITIPTITVWSE